MIVFVASAPRGAIHEVGQVPPRWKHWHDDFICSFVKSKKILLFLFSSFVFGFFSSFFRFTGDFLFFSTRKRASSCGLAAVRFFEESEGSETTCVKAFKQKRKKWDTQNGGQHFF